MESVISKNRYPSADLVSALFWTKAASLSLDIDMDDCKASNSILNGGPGLFSFRVHRDYRITPKKSKRSHKQILFKNKLICFPPM